MSAAMEGAEYGYIFRVALDLARTTTKGDSVERARAHGFALGANAACALEDWHYKYIMNVTVARYRGVSA